MNDIRIIRDKKELKDTCYMEILPGKYMDECWNKDSLYFEEEAFGFLEKAISTVVPSYDHYAFTEVSKSDWELIQGELRLILDNLHIATKTEMLDSQVYFFFKSTRSDFESSFVQNKDALASMIEEFSTWLTIQLKKNSCVTVLGM